MTPAGRAVSTAYLVPAGDFVGTVHSVFASAVNLAVDGRLLTVHDAASGHAPTSVLMAGRWTPDARPGDPVRCRAGMLTFGAHVLDLNGLPVWTPTAAPTAADAATVAERVRDVDTARHRHLTAHGIATPGLDQRVDALRRTLPTPDAAVERLVGFGPGLTPAGDDVLVGLLAALHRFGASPHLPAVAGAVRRRAHRTTDVSAHYLRLAAAGHLTEVLVGLVDAVAAGAAHDVTAARARDVLHTGASSGADAVAGVVLGVRALLPLPERKAA